MPNLSKEKLAIWGLYRKISTEQLIDSKVDEIEVNQSSIKEILDNWIKSNKIRSNEELENWKKYNGLNNTEFTKFVLRNWKWKEWCKKKFAKELPSYYLKRKPLLDSITYSILRVKDENLSLELFLRIKDKESSFKELAIKYSEGPEANSGGSIGPVSMTNVHPVIAKLLTISEAGQLWPPRKIEDWWIIIRLEELKNTELNDPVKNMLSMELGNQFLGKEFEKINKLNQKENKTSGQISK